MSMPMICQYQIDPELYLLKSTVPGDSAPLPPPVIHHVLVADTSGSMGGELEDVVADLKKNLPTLLNDQDTLTLVWFSGRGQWGIAFEGVQVSKVSDFRPIYQTLDRELRPRGLTGFLEPLDEIAQIKKRLAIQTGSDVVSLIFMSDGMENQWPTEQVYAAAARLEVAAALVVEYGRYADRNMLTHLARLWGGRWTFSKDAREYGEIIRDALKQGIGSSSRRTVGLWFMPLDGFVFALDHGDILSFAVSDGAVRLPQHIGEVYGLCRYNPGIREGMAATDATAALYALLALYGLQGRPDILWPVLKRLGDVKFIDQLGVTFGKEKYGEFVAEAKAAVFNEDRRLTQGQDFQRVPPEDALTVPDLLRLLTPEDKVVLEALDYKRISRATVDANTVLSDEEYARIEAEVLALGNGGNVLDALKSLQELTTEYLKAKKPLKFVADDVGGAYAMLDLVPAKDRANLSFRVWIPGTVDISDKLPPELRHSLPSVIKTGIFRQFAVLQDGLYNMPDLPLKLSLATRARLEELERVGRLPTGAVTWPRLDGITVLHVRRLPIVNRRQVGTASARDLFTLEWELLKAQAAQKVFNDLLDQHFPKESKTFKALYGEAGAAWLDSEGFKEYGFAPRRSSAAVSDEYTAFRLKTSFKGYSTLPKVEEVADKLLKGGKLNGPGQLMAVPLRQYNELLATKAYTNAANPNGILEAWLRSEAEVAARTVRDLAYQIGQIKFAIIVGGVWFQEFKDIGDGVLTMDLDGQPIQCTVEQKPEQVKI